MPTMTKMAPPGDQASQRTGTPHRPWTADDDARLAAMWPDYPRAEIAAALGRSVSSIMRRAHARGLGRPRQSGPRRSPPNEPSAISHQSSATSRQPSPPAPDVRPLARLEATGLDQAMTPAALPGPQPARASDPAALGDLVTAVRRVYDDHTALLARAIRAERERDEALAQRAIRHQPSAISGPGDGRDHPLPAHQDAARAPAGEPIAANADDATPVPALRLQLHRCLHDLASERARTVRLSILLAYQREALSDTHALRALGLSNAQLLDELSAVTHAGIAAAGRAVARRPPEDTRRTPG